MNSIKSSTNASTYMGKWFSMASEDGLNIERRRAEVSKKEGKKLYKRRDMEVMPNPLSTYQAEYPFVMIKNVFFDVYLVTMSRSLCCDRHLMR